MQLIYGLTFDNVDALSDALPVIHLLPHRPTVRVVIDNGRDILDYLNPVQKLASVADVMIQIQDSYEEKKLSDKQLYDKAAQLKKMFTGVARYWEIGNEVNGDWVSMNMAERLRKLAAIFAGTPRVITLFLDDEKNMLDWYRENPIPCEYLLVSHYPSDQAGMNQNWDRIFTDLAQYPYIYGVGIGEFGDENWKGHKSQMVTAYYKIKPTTPKWCLGGFYWDFQEQCVPASRALFKTLKKVWV